MKSSAIVLLSTILSVAFSMPVKRTIFGPQCYKMPQAGFCANAQMFPSGMRMNTTVSVSDRADVEVVLNSFNPLISTECAAELKKFLCFAYYPMCLRSNDGESHQIRPCRASCLAVRSKCELFVVASGNSWPESLDCDALSDDFCMPVSAPASEQPSTKCEDCQVKRKPSAVAKELCGQDSRIFVKARVLTEEVVGDAKSLVYNVQVEEVLSGKGDALPKPLTTTWIITTSREDCDCHKLNRHESYLLALHPQMYGDKVLYMLKGDAVVSEWSTVKDINVEKQLDNCPKL